MRLHCRYWWVGLVFETAVVCTTDVVGLTPRAVDTLTFRRRREVTCAFKFFICLA